MGSRMNTLGISRAGALKSFMRDVAERCPEDIYLAEFTRNAMQACGEEGEIVWFFVEDREGSGKVRWGIYDTGPGMTQQQMLDHLGQLRHSGGEVEGKHGIGARLSGLRTFPEGIEWLSLKGGCTASLFLQVDEGRDVPVYETDDDFSEDYLAPAILKAGHGTQVEFSGMQPESPARMPSESVARWLSRRWYARPKSLSLKVEFAERAKDRRGKRAFWNVPTQGEALRSLAELSEVVPLGDGSHVEIYVLPESLKGIPHGSRYALADLYTSEGRPKPKTGTVYENEVYQLTCGGGARHRLRRFGITHGHGRVVLLVFPNPELYLPNDARTRVERRLSGTSTDVELPWDVWQDEVARDLPQSIRDYVEDCAVGTERQNMDLIYEIMRERAGFILGQSARIGAGNSGGGRRPGGAGPRPKRRKAPNPQDKEKRERPPGKGEGKGDPHEAFSIPQVEWIVPDPDDPLAEQSGIYVPGPDVLQLNERWDELLAWSEHLQRKKSTSTQPMGERLALSYVKQATAMIHMDVVLRNRWQGEPAPEAEDFAAAMRLLTCRDLTLSHYVDRVERGRASA